MKKLFFSGAVICTALLLGCKKDKTEDPAPSTSNTTTTPPTPTVTPTPTYYITYKADGVAVSAKVISAVRDTTVSPRRLTLTGTATGGVNPVLTFYTEESLIGFTTGLNIQCYSGSGTNHFVNYTDASGTLFRSALHADGVYVYLSKISYKHGGAMEGSFSGTLKSAGANEVAITEGKFKTVFSN